MYYGLPRSLIEVKMESDGMRTAAVNSSPDPWSKEEPFVLMQFTGLLDKNGKEIFEGDVIAWGGKHLLVEWRDGGFGIRKPHLRRPKQTGWNWLGSIADPDEDVEIIGDIYANPELLKT